MKKIIYVLILSLVVVGGLVFANREIKNETSKKSISKPSGGVPSGGIPSGGVPLGGIPSGGVPLGGIPLSAAEMKAAKKQWEASPDGIMYKKWEASAAGRKVYASEAKIRQSISNYTNMEAVVTSLSLPTGSRVGFGVMVRINDEDFILSFGLEDKKEFEKLRSLKVDDKIIIKSRSVSHAPKYSYPIVAGDYVERDRKIIYNRPPRKDGC